MDRQQIIDAMYNAGYGQDPVAAVQALMARAFDEGAAYEQSFELSPNPPETYVNPYKEA